MKRILIGLITLIPFASYAQTISSLPAATTLGGTEVVAGVQSGITKKISINQTAAYVWASPTITGLLTTPLIKITSGSPGTGKVLTSDADGDATWETPTGGHVIEEEATPLAQRANLNFVGAGVTATDAGGKTVVTIPGGSTVTPSALTKTDDTNVTLTLGGTPTTALLQATSITVGWSGTLALSRLVDAAKEETIQIVIDGGGTVITTGLKGYVEIKTGGTITGWTAVSDVSGSISVDIWKDTYANFPPVVGDAISGSEDPTISTAVKGQDLSLSTWTTTTVTKGDWLAFNVDSATTVTRVTISIRYIRS